MKKLSIENKKIKVLFIRPPEPLWPLLNESDNFLMPLAYPALAGYLRKHIPELDIRIIDCLPLKIGWKSLAGILEKERPDIFCAGEQALYMNESMKAARLMSEIRKDTVIITGGHFHSFMVDYTFEKFPFVDYLVRFEGEEPLKNLIQALINNTDVSQVKSIAYRDGDQVRETGFGGVIEDMTVLPMPAYDLMPVHKYAPFGALWPRSATIEGSRGCVYDCDFCAWAAMGNVHTVKDGNHIRVPRYRKKAPLQSIAEIDYLYNEHDIRYLFWVEGTWNADNKWLEEVCTEIVRRKYKIGWWAFVKPDLLLEQEKNGLLPLMVQAGLSHVLLGGERAETQHLAEIGKHGEFTPDTLKEVLSILKNKYPSVFRQVTFITGIPSETKKSFERVGEYAREADIEFVAFHVYNPYPGTRAWDRYKDSELLEERDFSKWDMMGPVMRGEYLSREEISQLNQKIHVDFIMKQPFKYLKGLVSPYGLRFRIHWWILFSTLRVFAKDVLYGLILRKRKFYGFGNVSVFWKPAWYDK